MNLPAVRACVVSIFLLLFSVSSSHAQSPIKTYDKQWKVVADFVKKQLPKSALAEVQKIYALAKRENQEAQTIKSLVYMIDLQTENRDNNDVLSIAEIEKEIATSKQPATSILNSLLADLYWRYYNIHRWQMYNRTQTMSFKKDDIATWGTEDFHSKISSLFLASIQEERLLQQTRLEPYDAIIVKGNVRHLRPTLFDLLAHRALEYFKNDERDLRKPAYAFQIDQAEAFAPAEEFSRFRFTARDSLSLQHKALLVYQKLLAFHLTDAKPDALLDVDIQRILFVRTKSVHPERDKLYFSSLERIANKYGNIPAASQAWFFMASYYEEKANSYFPFGDTTHRFARMRARDILERILAQKDSSEGKTNSFNLLNQIKKPQLEFKVEKVNLPQQPFRALVSYRNFTQVYFRLVKQDDKVKTDLYERQDDKYWSRLLALKPIRSWDQALPDTRDMQTHHSEIKVDALPIGEYILIVSTDKAFSLKKGLLGSRVFFVSNISFVNSGRNYFVLNRDNGRPLERADVQVWEQKYDYRTSKYVRQKFGTYATDKNGYFELALPKEQPYGSHNYNVEIRHGGDHLDMNEFLDDYYYYPGPNIKTPALSIFLFSDRSLYRPGQTVFFKGIALDKNPSSKTASIRTGLETTVYLTNPNSQRVDSLKVKTNEFGSFSGKFQLPAGTLNGQFSIGTYSETQITIQVEEYKRPKFYVEYEPLKGTYQVNELVRVTGTAKAYAGNTIDGATVSYRVIRQPRFLYPWMFWRGWYPPAAPMEIAHGIATTDKDGRFEVAFTAIPDLSIDRKLDPVFDYKVYADVTDINGETRSAEKVVSVSYKSLLLKVVMKDKIATDSLNKIFIRSENMSGEYAPALARVVITRLKEEKRLIRPRLWERPDQFVMTKEEFIRNFPFDEYANESDPKSWEKGEKVFEKTDSIRSSGDWTLNGSNYQPGYYVVEIFTKDKKGEDVKDVRYVELYDRKSNRLNLPEYLWTEATGPLAPGQRSAIQLGTSADNLFVIKQTDKGTGDTQENKSEFSFLSLNNEKRAVDVLATEADRGGFGIAFLFVKHNRFFQFSQAVEVPWTNKMLGVEFATYRDKALPGSAEKWKIKLTGPGNEKLAAEMLASMYDASLDQFYGHQWSIPGIWPVYANRLAWNGSKNFAAVQAMIEQQEGEEYKFFNKRYDVLLTSINSYDGNVYGRGARYYKMAAGAPPVVTQTSPVAEESMRLEGRVAGIDVVGNTTRQADSAVMDNAQTGGDKEQIVTSDDPAVQVRKNFNETVFFFPELRTDSSGAIEFSFTLPDALTRWKFQAFAHTKDLAFGYASKEIITQKQLMVQPNAPRFLREGDKIVFSAKIVNLAEQEMNGNAELQLFDAATNQPVDAGFKHAANTKPFKVTAGQSAVVVFPLDVPSSFSSALVWKIVAKATKSGPNQLEAFSDGEENVLPVLSNRMLVTETLPMHIRGTGTKTFSFDKLLQSGNSGTLKNHTLTIEYTSNPSWYAVQALPYLMEYPYECAEQIWNRYYANSIATMIVNSAPRLKQIFEQWKTIDTAALMSNLEKNQELKSVLLEETPWVLQAKTEAEQKRNIALLFDMVHMSGQLNGSYQKLKEMQSSNGGFVWFKGGPDDRYMTQYIVTGIGHLRKLNAEANGQDPKLRLILSSAIPYLDQKMAKDYADLVKSKADLAKQTPGSYIIQYLYMRSFFPEYKMQASVQTAYNYFRGRAQKTWTQQSKYMQGMLTLALGRTGDATTPAAILKSLKETSINNEELGMYWKDSNRGWWWYELPIERQALLIEAFHEIGKDTRTVDDLRTWLLKNKQTNNWESTKATAEACYALLLTGSSWTTADPTVRVQLGNTTVSSTDNKLEAGTGYFKKTIEGSSITPSMGNISLSLLPSSNPGTSTTTGPSWGAVYWQYFEDLDKITNAATPLQLSKKLFVETGSDRGPVLSPVNNGATLKIGDKIKVRIELKVDRDMEYVHMKDMRAAAMEPVNVLSGYKWQGGLGYYETTRDASTNFFFNHLRKGTYVFEYTLFVTHAGDFSNGITTIQSMYAPEFSSHSEGIRVKVQ